MKAHKAQDSEAGPVEQPDPLALGRAVEAAAAFEIAEGDPPGQRRALAQLAAALIPYMEAGGDIYPTGPEERLLSAFERAIRDVPTDEPETLADASIEFVKANRREMQRLFDSFPIPFPLKGREGNWKPITWAGPLMLEPREQADWIVDGMIPAGSTALLVGSPKAGKSTLARNLGLAVAQGRDWLGRDCRQGPALYVAHEGRRAAVAEHLATMNADSRDRLAVYHGPPLNQPFAWLRHVIEENEFSLVILDTMFRFQTLEDGNHYTQISDLTQNYIDIAADTGCAIVALHHSRKGGGEQGEEVLGSTALFASVDTLLSLKNKDGYRSIYTVQREGEDMPETALRMDASRQWIYPGEMRHETAARELQNAILETIRSEGAPMTAPEVVKAVRQREAAVRKALNQLVADGILISEGEGTRGKPRLFRFPEEK